MAYSFKKPTNNTYEPIPAGTYEAEIVSASFAVSNSGSEYINLRFKIREDVEQNGKGRNLFASIFKWDHKYLDGQLISKTFYDSLSPDKQSQVVHEVDYDRIKLETIIGNRYIPKDEEEEVTFDNIDEIVQFLNGLEIKIKVNKAYDDRRGEDTNTIDLNRCSVTGHPTKVSRPQPKIKISEPDLPF